MVYQPIKFLISSQKFLIEIRSSSFLPNWLETVRYDALPKEAKNVNIFGNFFLEKISYIFIEMRSFKYMFFVTSLRFQKL